MFKKILKLFQKALLQGLIWRFSFFLPKAVNSKTLVSTRYIEYNFFYYNLSNPLSNAKLFQIYAKGEWICISM